MENPYQVYVLPLAYEQLGLLYAVLGLTAIHMGIQNNDLYLRETLAVEYRVRAIGRLGQTLQNGLSGELSENERDGIFVTIQILLLQDVSCLLCACSRCNRLILSSHVRYLNRVYPPTAPTSQVLCLFAINCAYRII